MLSRSAAYTPVPSCVPVDGLPQLKQNWETGLSSGLLVSLIVLPLRGLRLSIKSQAVGLMAIQVVFALLRLGAQQPGGS